MRQFTTRYYTNYSFCYFSKGPVICGILDDCVA